MNRDTATARKLTILAAASIGAFLLAAPAQAQRTSLADIDGKLNEVLDILNNVPPPPTERVVFVTSTSHDGNFGGLAGADAICNARAKEAGLPDAGNYLAWLSTDALSPADRFVRSTVPYVRTDGITIASDWDDLTDGFLAASIELDERGVPGGVFVLTGTQQSGVGLAVGARTCLGWTSADISESAILGDSLRADGGWSASLVSFCSLVQPHYCFQQ